MSKLECFLQKSKENLIIEQKHFVLWSIKCLNLFWHTQYCTQFWNSKEAFTNFTTSISAHILWKLHCYDKHFLYSFPIDNKLKDDTAC